MVDGVRVYRPVPFIRDTNSSKVVIGILTHNRPRMLINLLKQIREFRTPVRLLVFNDGSKKDYRQAEEYLKNFNHYYERTIHHGKKKHWVLHNRMFARLALEDFGYFIQLPDDVALVDDFERRVFSQFKETGTGALNLLCTTAQRKVFKGHVKIGKHHYYNKPWIDCCMITTRDFFIRIGWRCPEIPMKRWDEKPSASSGVGTALTKKYIKAGGRIMVCMSSLVHHNGVKSMMNPHRTPFSSNI